MPEARDKHVDVIAKLTELTQNGALEWSIDAYTDVSAGDSPMYLVTHKETRLRLQKRRVPDEDGWGRSAVRDQYVLEVVSADGKTLWAFPELAATADLFAAVQYQTAGVRDFIDNILSDES